MSRSWPTIFDQILPKRLSSYFAVTVRQLNHTALQFCSSLRMKEMKSRRSTCCVNSNELRQRRKYSVFFVWSFYKWSQCALSILILSQSSLLNIWLTPPFHKDIIHDCYGLLRAEGWKTVPPKRKRGGGGAEAANTGKNIYIEMWVRSHNIFGWVCNEIQDKHDISRIKWMKCVLVLLISCPAVLCCPWRVIFMQ